MIRNPAPGRLLRGLLVASAVFLFSCDSKPSGPPAEDEGLSIAWTEENAIVCMGTSLTFGYGAGCRVLPPRADCEADSAYPALLQERLSISVVNLGFPGATSAEGLSKVDEALSHAPVLVILEFGANDFFREVPVAVVRNNIATMIERLQARAVQVALLSFVHPDMVPGTPESHFLLEHVETSLEYHAMLAGLAAEYDLPVVDYILEGIWGHPELMYDWVHPNGRGYVKMEENIFRGLKEVFETSSMLR